MISILVLHTHTELTFGCDMLNSFTCLSHYLHEVRLDVLITSHWWNNGGVSLLLNFPLSSPLYRLLIAHVHHGTYYGARGFITPRITVIKVRTLFQYSSAPRTYSIICIGSESCLWSIVGLPSSCATTLHSAISARLVKGELLRLCPGSSGWAPQ